MSWSSSTSSRTSDSGTYSQSTASSSSSHSETSMSTSLKRQSKLSIFERQRSTYEGAAAKAKENRRLWGGNLAPPLAVRTLVNVFCLLAIISIPSGIMILVGTFTVQELKLDYTDCLSTDYPDTPCYMVPKDCLCQYKLDTLAEQAFSPKVYVYYGLSNFFQNHRKYKQSFSEEQLGGDLFASSTAKCTPYQKVERDDLGVKTIIAPCGAVANSLFNDSFALSMDSTEIPISEKGISWPADNYFLAGSRPSKFFSNTSKPISWEKGPGDLSEDPANKGFANERLRVWMRIAALPEFRKMWGIVERRDGLPKGNYTLTINYNYPVKEFNGRKTFILSNTSLLGGRNFFLAFTYLGIGIISLATSCVFDGFYRRYGHAE